MGSDSGFMIGFAILVVTILALDLGVFNRNSHRVTVREATIPFPDSMVPCLYWIDPGRLRSSLLALPQTS